MFISKSICRAFKLEISSPPDINNNKKQKVPLTTLHRIITILLLIGGFIEYEILENMEEIMGVLQ